MSLIPSSTPLPRRSRVSKHNSGWPRVVVSVDWGEAANNVALRRTISELAAAKPSAMSIQCHSWMAIAGLYRFISQSVLALHSLPRANRRAGAAICFSIRGHAMNIAITPENLNS